MKRGQGRSRRGWILPLAIAISAALAALAPPALARTFTVNDADDAIPPGPCRANGCTLRAAVFAANDSAGEDTIRFASSLPPRIELTEGELLIRSQLVIEGRAAGDLAISAAGSRVFHMTTGRVRIADVTIRDGDEAASATGARCPATSAAAYTLGGAILQEGGRLRLENVKVTRNSVVGDQNSIIGGGAIANVDGRLFVVASRIVDNAVLGGAISGGGAILNCVGEVEIRHSTVRDAAVAAQAIGFGGAITNGLGAAHNTGELALTKTTVRRSDASSSAIAAGGGVATTGGPVTVTGTTIAENSATATGGGTIADAGGLYVANARATVTNSTIAENLATAPNAVGGGILVGGTEPRLVLRSATVARNLADGTTTARGGNVSGAAEAKALNTIVAKGRAQTGANCDAEMRATGHDLEDANTCGFDGRGDLANRNPKLADLARNGGPTETMALRRGSPAIDHAASKSSPKRDQRGFLRVGKPDIGAYEFGAVRNPGPAPPR